MNPASNHDPAEIARFDAIAQLVEAGLGKFSTWVAAAGC